MDEIGSLVALSSRVSRATSPRRSGFGSPAGPDRAARSPTERKPAMTTTQDSTPTQEPSRAQQLIGDFAPKLVELTDDVLFGDVWARPELAPRDRSLITCAALITNGSTEQLRAHLGIAKDQRGDRVRTQGGDHPPCLLRRLAASNVGDHGREGRLRRLSVIGPPF